MYRLSLIKRIIFCVAITILLAGLGVVCIDVDDCYASEDTVRAYLTVSSDGEFVVGNDPDSTVLASTPIDVDYFGLAEYGLERYTYDKAEESEQPTLLHLFIRATEKYYLGRKMTPEDFDTDAMMVTNSPGSLFLMRFWGHDQNLMYHFNHEYPYKDKKNKIGATCDQILVSDGDTVDVAMFTNWGISTTGAFAFFSDNNHLSASTGDVIELSALSVGGMMGGMELQKTIMNNGYLKISRDNGKTWALQAAQCDNEGYVLLQFTEPGTYYVSSGPRYKSYEDIIGADYECVAPPICVIEVTGEPVESTPHTVRFEVNGGSAIAEQTVGRYSAAEKPADPVRSGYDFDGWYTDSDLKTAYDFDLAVQRDITLYAGWKESETHAEERRKQELAAKAKAAKAIVKVKALKKHKAKITWKKVTLSYIVNGKKYTSGTTGYKIYRATKKSGKYKVIKTVKKAKTLKYTDRKLKKGKKYFYKVRTYTKIDGKIYLGKWSAAKKIRAK